MLRIATRRSRLARAQAHQVGLLLRERTGTAFELVPMATTGDRSPERAVTAFDTKGLFVDTLREAVVNGDCALAVHSYKDLPHDPVEGLALAAVPARADPRDLLVTRAGHALATLPATATVGTSSERRRIQLLRTKPALQVLALRGNLDTRLQKVADGEYDAVVVAAAGMQRLYSDPARGGAGPLGLPLRAYALEPGECLPAPAQGALAIECRADDETVLALCRRIVDPATARAVRAERAFAAALGGGCTAAVGALCRVTADGRLDLSGLLADPPRRRMVRRSLQGAYGQPERLGRDLAADVRAALEGGR